MITINHQTPLSIDLDNLQLAARLALETSTDMAGADLTIVIGDDILLHQYNHQYLGIDAPTDVLSFPADFTDPETGNRYLGDILISLARAQDQAVSGGHSLIEELELLVVHGVLHLLGHDHAEKAEKSRMQTAQDALIARLGSQVSPRL